MSRFENAAVPQYIMALSSDHAPVRENATRSLGNIGANAAAAIPYLRRGLNDSDPDVRKWSIWALGQMGTLAREAEPEIREFLKDPDLTTRDIASEASEKVLGVYNGDKWRV